jgi:hypothetical protein
MKIQDLREGISSILFHYTSANNLLTILNANKFRLTPDIGTSAEAGNRKGDKIYYGSFARSMAGTYHYPVSKYAHGSSIIVVDGRKLSADGYSGNPLDYWGFGDNDEMEDRIYSKRPHVEDFNRYIKEIHMYMPAINSGIHDEGSLSKMARKVRQVYRVAKQKGIPVYVYSEPRYLHLLAKGKATPISNYKPTTPAEKPFPTFPARNHFASYIAMLNVDDPEKLNDRARRDLRNLMYSMDAARSVAADVHNARNNRERPNLDKFIRELQRRNINSIEGFVEFIRKKFDTR